MSPEEFADSPLAIFHSSSSKKDEVRNMQARKQRWREGVGTSPHMHLGTEQAALENAGRLEDSKGAGSARRLYTYWYQPKVGDSLEVHNDSEVYTRPEYGDTHPDELAEQFPDYDDTRAGMAGDFDPKYEYSHDIHPFPTILYKNTGEDRGSISVSLNDASRLKSHADYVQEAIASGKGHEVHPKTMEMFRQGHLDRGEILPAGFASNIYYKSNPRRGNQDVLKPTDWRGEEKPESYGFPEYWKPDNQTPAEKVSNRGPKVSAIVDKVLGK
jgi:hypothetical protein